MKKTTWTIAGAAVLAAGVIAGGTALAQANNARQGPASPSAATQAAASRPEAQQAAGTAAWPGTTQFMEISGGEIRGGIVYLKVRPAIKEPLGESFKTKPGSGPFTEVAMADSSRTLTLDGESGSPEVFVDTLKKRTKEIAGEAFDVTFDSQGKVTTVEWLYVPGPGDLKG